MKFARHEIESLHFLFYYFDPAFVRSSIQAALHRQSGLGRRARNQTDNRSVIGQRTSAPVGADECKESMLDFVPFSGARRKVTNRNLQLLFR